MSGVNTAKIKESEDSSYSAKLTNSQKQSDVNISKVKSAESVDKGQGFNEDANDTQEKVVVIDRKLAKDVFNNHALGKSLYIEGQGFKIVGIANSSGQSMMALQGDNSVKMPSKTFSQYMGNLTQDMPTLQLNLDKDANKKDVAKKVEKQLNKKGSGTSDGSYMYSDMESMMKNINTVFDSITYFVAAVAGISLFIAGIGVMNVMYISVAERTEEIAIRRAFGAKGRDIEIQFLVESIVLCLIGGIIGLILGILIATCVDALTPKMIKSSVSIGSIIIAVGVSTLIGIIFGWIPARAASKKELIDIIK